VGRTAQNRLGDSLRGRLGQSTVQVAARTLDVALHELLLVAEGRVHAGGDAVLVDVLECLSALVLSRAELDKVLTGPVTSC
jgi:hypothetical protein